jgi:hypothetical protein
MRILLPLPEGWSVTNLNSTTLVGVAGDSLLLSFILSIPDTNNLPFYPQDIELEMQLNRKDSLYQSVILAGKVYFTPYNSIDIWNLEDFYNLNYTNNEKVNPYFNRNPFIMPYLPKR